MKRMKKLLAVLIVMAMTLMMGVTAFAAGGAPTVSEQKKVTINNPVKGHTYTAYQILSGVVASGNELTRLDWGTGITDNGKATLKEKLGLEKGATVAQVAVKLAGISSNSTDMDEVAQILGDNVTTIGTPLTAGEGGSVAATVAQGYYVILDSITGDAPEGSTISKYMVQVVGDVAINTKAQQTTSQKTVSDANSATAKFTEANIGKEKTFYLLATLPEDYTAYTAFYMNFRDTMHHMDFVSLTGVTVKRNVSSNDGADGKKVYDPSTGDVVATINAQDGNDAINGYKLTAPAAPGENEVTNTVSNNLSVEIKDLKQIVADAKAGDCVIVEYKAKLNSTALVNAANVNEFDLVFSNDPNSTVKPGGPNDNPNIPTGVTPKDQADLYTTEIELLKVDGTTGDILTGAEFTLSGNTNNVVIKTATVFTVSENGEYWKLKNGTYTKDDPATHDADRYESTKTKYAPTVTTEVVGTPTKTDIKAEVGADGKVTFTGLGEGTYTLIESKVPAGYNKMDDKTFKITFDVSSKTFSVSEGLGSLVATIENFSGSTLPSTGGIGTTIFYIIGGILVIGAAILLVTKKRMSKEA
ncbi:MAG: LPXTG cell wall anchor domain-containing protein [Lachnospiraceae bacterium]|jgi:LPXTG-motif cell wall-anchored protein|nr:LPXTG cell wall anchor domain-containing protein [Lachnospiraceae bacterium]